MGTRPLTPVEQRIFNKGERLIPGVTHDMAQYVRHRSSYEFFRAVIEADLAGREGPISIVDLGCGVGHGSEVLAGIPGTRVFGVDSSAEAIGFAREFYPRENVEYEVCDLVSWIPAAPEFDFAVSRNVFEHIHGGLALAGQVRWRRRFLFDLPYDEPPGYNPHHIITRILEGDLASFPGAELFCQDGCGVIFDAPNKPPDPKIVVCICRRAEGPRLVDIDIPFPFAAWRPDQTHEAYDRSGKFGGFKRKI